MNLSPLQIFAIIVGFVFFIFAVDFWQRKKFNLLHFIVFFWWSLLLILFSLDITLLNKFGAFFGLNRGADLVVYLSILILGYLYFELLNAHHRFKIKFTNLNRELTLQSRFWKTLENEIVFIIPAYNESDEAVNVIWNILSKWYWVVFIDDGSNNYLYRKLRDNFDTESNNIVFMRHPVNMWQWAALETWFEYLRRHWEKVKFVVTFDSDWQHRLEDISEFTDAFNEDKNLEIVLWSRFLWSTQNLPKLKKLVLKLWIIFTRFLSGIKLTDTHNGYRVFKISVLDKIKLTMNWMEHASEFIDIIKDKKIKYKEVPIVILYTEYSIKKWQKLSNAFKIASNMIYKKFFYK